MTPCSRLQAPATGRNRDPILEVMRRVFPVEGLVLEISSGSGEHAAYFSRQLPNLHWQPTDVDPAALESIAAWREEGSPNLLAPLSLDARSDIWPVADTDVIVNINMIHISPWEACQGLMRGAGRTLVPGGLLFLYGPYRVAGRHTAPSNESFDASLRERNPEWGVRDLEQVLAEAEACGITFCERVAMPANNFSLILQREGDGF